jgi:putative endonuclease
MKNNVWYVYIIECEDASLYVGVSTDIKRRFLEHKSGKGSKYVRSKKAKRIIFSETHDNKYSAFKREIEIKGYSRQKKLKLIESKQ